MWHIRRLPCAMAAHDSGTTRPRTGSARGMTARGFAWFIRIALVLLANATVQAGDVVRYEFQYFEGRDGHRIVEVYDIAESPDGAIWVATWGDGLHEIHNTDYKNYSTATGLAADWFRGIEHVGHGALWAHTEDGLYRISDERSENPLEQVSADVTGSDYRLVHLLSDGRVLVCTTDGPTLIFESKTVPSFRRNGL